MKMKSLLSMVMLSSIFSIAIAQNYVSEVEDSLESFISENRSAGVSAGYASADEIMWLRYEGFADQASQRLVDSSTLFRMASIAKPITAVAIMQLYEKGQIELDKPISEYIPDFPIMGGGSITVRHLLNHSSGLGGYKSEKEAESIKEYPSLREAIQVFENRKLNFSPGSKFNYTSYGYVVLGWIIEKLSGLTYEDYIQKEVFSKAGMYHTGVEKFNEFLPSQTKFYVQKNRNPKKYKAENNKVREVQKTNLSNRIPGGGFYTTAEDMLKFGQAILNNTLISEKSLKLMWLDSGVKKKGNPYGMGWYLYGESRKYGDIYGHSGTQTGAANQLMILPKEKLVTVILSNTSHTWGHVFGMILNFPAAARRQKGIE